MYVFKSNVLQNYTSPNISFLMSEINMHEYIETKSKHTIQIVHIACGKKCT